MGPVGGGMRGGKAGLRLVVAGAGWAWVLLVWVGLGCSVAGDMRDGLLRAVSLAWGLVELLALLSSA
ncbi:hypothetical protein Tco_0743547 [Tanacetum coccineum]